MPASTATPLLIDQQATLDNACDELARHQQLAVDTEFVRTSTYHPHLGLIQISAGDIAACIDPLAGLDLTAIWEMLFDGERLKVLHAAKQDLEVLYVTCERVPELLLDTQIQAGLLGHPAQIGYAALTKALLNVEISKSQTRTDWSRRPLTAAQIQYAAEDVEFLPELHQRMSAELRDLGRFDWAREDSAALADPGLYTAKPDEAWQRLKRVPFLPAEQQSRVRRLADWRERRALQANKPRQWIISDQALLDIAAAGPADIGDLDRCTDLPPAVLRKQGARLLEVVAQADRDLADGKLNIEQRERPDEAEPGQIKRLQQIVRGHADRLGVVAEVLASRRELAAMIRGARDQRPLRGWRRSEFGAELLDAL